MDLTILPDSRWDAYYYGKNSVGMVGEFGCEDF